MVESEKYYNKLNFIFDKINEEFKKILMKYLIQMYS